MSQGRLKVSRQKWNTNRGFPQLKEVSLYPRRKTKYWDIPNTDRREKRRII